MTIQESLKRIDNMIDAYTIAKRCGCQIDIPIDEDLEALMVARNTLSAIDIPDNPTNGDNNVENKIKYKEHSEDIVELEDVNNTMISIHDLVAYYNQIQIMKSEGIYPEDMTFYFSCECEMDNESEE